MPRTAGTALLLQGLLLAACVCVCGGVLLSSLLPLSGAVAPTGVQLRKAMQLAVEDVNRGGLLPQATLALNVSDTRVMRTVAVSLATELLQVGASPVFVSLASRCTGRARRRRQCRLARAHCCREDVGTL
jgi:hypothetical protein